MPKQFLWRPISITPTKAGKKTKIHIPQPEYKALQLNKRDMVRWEDVNIEVDWFTLHKRGVRRPKVGEDPLEMRAVPHGYIKGTLPERIVYYYLTNYMRMQSGIDFDFQCLAGHHKVITKDLRWVQIKDLKVGDELLNFSEYQRDPRHGKVDPRTSRRYFETGTVLHNLPGYERCTKVTLSNGTEIIATKNHPWLVLGRRSAKKNYLTNAQSVTWATTEELTIGQTIPKYLDVWDTNISREAGYLAGFFDADGNICHKIKHGRENGISVTYGQQQNNQLAFLLSTLDVCGFDYGVGVTDDPRGHLPVCHIPIRGGRKEQLKFLGSIRPTKLYDQFEPERLGRIDKIEQLTVTKLEDVGLQEIYRLAVSNKTYFCEGLGMHNSSLEGGRMQLGGMVVDFLFPQMRIIIQVQGPTHDTFLRKAKDNQQIDDLSKMGYTVYELDDSVIYDEYLLEEWMRRTFSLPAGVGGSGGAHGAHEGDLTDVEILYQRVLAVQQGLINYFGV